MLILNYGCKYQGGYVYALDDRPLPSLSVRGKVVTTSEQSNGVVWSSNGTSGSASFDLIPGIDQTSTSTTGSPSYSDFTAFFGSTYNNSNPFSSASFSVCNAKLDGQCATKNILTFYNQFVTHSDTNNPPPPKYTAAAGPTDLNLYAAGLCKKTINTYSDWYLPAVCEMGYGFPCGTQANPSLQNIEANLIDSSVVHFVGFHWTSTEVSPGFNPPPKDFAWYYIFGPGTSAGPDAPKTHTYKVVCSRIFN